MCQHLVAIDDPTSPQVCEDEAQFESALSRVDQWQTMTARFGSAVATSSRGIFHTKYMLETPPAGRASAAETEQHSLTTVYFKYSQGALCMCHSKSVSLLAHILYIALKGSSLSSSSIVDRVVGISFRCSALTKQTRKLIKT